MDVDLVELFDDLVRLETELWNRVETRIQQAHGVPLAWLEIIQGRGGRLVPSAPQPDRWSIQPDPADRTWRSPVASG